MISFFTHLLLLLRTLVYGFREDPEFRAMAVLLAALLAGGTLFYRQVEHWSILDSLYFCVMTISTIGYGDFAPTRELSKLFSIGYAILGIGLFASFVGKLVMLRMQHHAKAKQKHHHDGKK
jgi:hypothetical protein